MKIKNLSFLFLLFIAMSHPQQTAPSIAIPASKTTISNDDPTDAQLKETQAETAALAFLEMPTNSINENIIDQIYGPTGLNIATESLNNIKKTYCYLEFLIKKNKVEYDQNFAKYQEDFKDFLQSSKDNILRKPTQALVESNGWKSIPVTSQDLIDSDGWQIFIKSMICDSFDNNSNFLVDSTQINNQMFVNLANIEMAYPTTDFTKLRLLQESIQIETFMQNEQQQRYIVQSIDWKKNQLKDIVNGIKQFKKTDFYINSHLPQATTQTPGVIPNKTTEQILLYFMLLNIQTAINDLVLSENVSNFLNKASSKKLAPNFFNYMPSDLILMQDLLTLQNLSEAAKVGAASSISMQSTPEGGVPQNTKAGSSAPFQQTTSAKPDTRPAPEQVADIIFKIVPTISINEKNFDEIYGSKGLNIPEDLLNNIKQVYCYLEFLIKIDKVKSDKKFAQYKTDFKSFLEPRSDGAPVIPTDLLVKSNGWQAVTITNDDIINSAIWQNYIKSMICDIFDSQSTFITNNKQTNNQLFSYLPSIETAYPTNDFTELRLYGESMQAQLQLGSLQLQKYVQQCNDWKNIDTTKLADTIAQFKKTDFYQYSHATGTPDKKTKKNPAPSFIEQLTLNFLLLNIESNLFELLNTDNLTAFLKQANSAKNLPNFFTYSQNDFIYLYDFLTITKLAEQNKLSPEVSIVVMQGGLESQDPSEDANDDQDVVAQSIKSDENIDPSEDSVIIQKIKNPFTKKNFDPAKNGVNKSIAKTNKASNKALDPAQNGFDKNITNPSKKAFDKGMKDFNIGIEKMCIGMKVAGNALTTALIETMVGEAFVACSFAQLFDPSINPRKQAGILRNKMEKERGTLNAIASSCLLITAAIIMIPLGPSAYGIAAYMFTTDEDLSGGAFNTVVMDPLMVVFEALDWLTNACTTAFIEATYWETYVCYWIANGFGGNYNPEQEANHVKAVLEKHRSTINIVMGIVITIVSTILIMYLTAGAAAAFEAAAIANLFGTTVMTRVTGQVAARAAAQVALREAAVITARKAAELALKESAEAAAEASLKKLAEQTAKEAFETAAEGVVKKAAQITAKNASKASAEAAASAQKLLAQATLKKAEQVAAEKALSSAIIVSNQATLTSGASQTVVAANEKLAAKQLAETSAKQALEKAIASGADDGVRGVLQGNIATATSERQAAQLSAQTSKDFALKQSSNLSKIQAQQTADKAVAQAAVTKTASKQTTTEAVALGDDVINPMFADQAIAKSTASSSEITVSTSSKTAAQSSSKTAAQSTTKTAAQKAAQEEASELATKNATKIAAEHAQSAAGKQSIALAEKQAAKTNAEIALKNAQNNADDLARMAPGDPQVLTKEMAERAAVDLAEKQTALKTASSELDDMATGILKSRTDALNAMSTYSAERIREQGMLTVMKDMSFVLGQVFNVGFGVFSIIGAMHEDDAAAEAAKQEKESIQALWRFVEDNKVSSVQSQNLFMDELHKKHQAAVANQTFGLQYYSNFLNSSINMVQAQISQALTQQQIQLLTPDSNGMRIADIGSSWGLQTPFTYLYPSQGFISTTLGRPDFPYAQEVAQAPLASENHGNKKIDLSDNQPAATKLWFKQRAISILNQPAEQPLNVEIRFRILYNLDTAYHIGLYLGGKYQDYESAAYLKSIQDKNAIDLSEAHLAKMFVLKRDDAKSAPSVGLYENEGKGWITQHPVDANTLNTASIYHMSAQLNKTTLTIGFWSEANPSAKWTQTVSVTACDQRTFGVIFSGAAIEWGVVQPTQPIAQNKTARVASNGQSEVDRERASKAKWKQIMNPKFGSLTMQSFGRPAILQGQYVYTTQSTGLVDGQGKPQTDYMIFATSSGNNVTSLGSNPAPSDGSVAPNIAVSLITGNAYNSSGKIITNVQNALDVYALNSNAISQSLGEAIAQAGKDYQQQLLNFKFGTYQLTALSQNAIDAGLFIYTCPTSTATKDSSGRPILDYLIMADIVNGSLGSTVGMPPSTAVQGMISLITGNVYGKESATPIDSGYSPLTQYTKQYGELPQDIANAINSAAQAYNNSVNAQTATKETTINVMASQTMSFTDLMNALPPSTGGFEFGISSAAPSNIVATNSTISQLQTAAAGGATFEFSGMGAAGFGFGDASSSNQNIPAQQTYSIPNQDFGGANLSGETYEMPTNDQAIDTTYADQDTSNNFDDTTAIHDYDESGYGFDDNFTPVEQNISEQITPAATIDYSDFGLAGSSGFSF